MCYDSYDKLHNIHDCAPGSIYRCTTSCVIRCERVPIISAIGHDRIVFIVVEFLGVISIYILFFWGKCLPGYYAYIQNVRRHETGNISRYR